MSSHGYTFVVSARHGRSDHKVYKPSCVQCFDYGCGPEIDLHNKPAGEFCYDDENRLVLAKGEIRRLNLLHFGTFVHFNNGKHTIQGPTVLRICEGCRERNCVAFTINQTADGEEFLCPRCLYYCPEHDQPVVRCGVCGRHFCDVCSKKFAVNGDYSCQSCFDRTLLDPIGTRTV